MALNYDYLTATTQKYFVPKVVDNIYNSSAVFQTLLMDGKIREYRKGGERIVEPLRYEKMTAGGKYSNWDTFSVVPPDNITGADYLWSSYYSTIAISGDDEDKNMGESQVVNLLSERTKEAEDYLKDILSADLFEGTASDEFQGLNLAVAQGTYAGIAGGTLM